MGPALPFSARWKPNTNLPSLDHWGDTSKCPRLTSLPDSMSRMIVETGRLLSNFVHMIELLEESMWAYRCVSQVHPLTSWELGPPDSRSFLKDGSGRDWLK